MTGGRRFAIALAAVGLTAGCHSSVTLLQTRDGALPDSALETETAPTEAGAEAGDGADPAGQPDVMTTPGDAGPDADAAIDGNADGGDAQDGPASGGVIPFTVSIGLDPLVDAFPAATGIIVVRQGHVELLSRAGQSLALLTWPRQITAATFDGTTLAVVDRAKVTALDAGLVRVGDTPLAEACLSVAAVPGGFVCPGLWVPGPAFSTYDPRGGGARVSSPGGTPGYSGLVFRVPGRNLILFGGLYEVSATGALSPFPGISTSAATDTLAVTYLPYGFVAFDREPAERVVSSDGTMYRITPPGCDRTAPPEKCLVPEGTLPIGDASSAGTDTILTMVGDGAGNVQALHAPRNYLGDYCRDGCSFDVVDTDTKTIEKSKRFRLALWGVISAHYDATIDGMVLGYASPDGYQVDLLDFSSRARPPGPVGPDPSSGPAPVPPRLDSSPSGCVPSGPLLDGPTEILTAAPVSGGAIVVRDDGAVRVDRAGNVVASAPRARMPSTASFDDGTLVIGDDQGFALYDERLQLLHEIPVAGGCPLALAPAGGGRVVCQVPLPGATDNSSSVFATYSIASGALLTTSSIDVPVRDEPKTLRRLPGADALVGVAPSGWFSLLSVAPDGAVSFVSRSYLDGWAPYAFYGSGRSGALPAHVINASGSILQIFGPECRPTINPIGNECFIPDGEVGTQWGRAVPEALADDGGGHLFTIQRNAEPASALGCQQDCWRIQQVDLASRRVVSSRTHSIPDSMGIISTSFDAECGMLLVAHSTNRYGIFRPTAVRYRVDLLDYGAP